MSEWQPIETALKVDESTIVGAWIENGRWRALDLWWWSRPGMEGWYDTYDYHGPWEPTHWMPLPEPPKDNAQ